MNPKQRIQKLQSLLKQTNIDAYLVLTSDPHLSEYIPQHWQEREYLSGFSGSAGVLIVMQENAFLFTDGRYFLQAENELQGSDIKLQKIINNKDSYLNWILENLKPDSIIATNGEVLPSSLESALRLKLLTKNITLKTDMNLISKIWENRPPLPQNIIYEHNSKYCYKTSKKLTLIRKEMQRLNATHHLISSLDDIAWIMNLRGSDIPYNPLFLSYLLLSQTEITLFINNDKLMPKIKSKLEKDNVKIKSYDEIFYTLDNLNGNVLLDPSKTTSKTINHLTKCKIIESKNPSSLLKAQKTKLEIKHIKDAMISDGIALCEFFAWLITSLKKEKITELTIDEKLQYFRSQNELYITDSFSTIAGFNENGALPHYKATKQHNSTISRNGLLLIDSGGQYQNGTTDITRVIPIGKITKKQKIDYTLVLKANIALSMAVFPKDISLSMLDSIARMPLWKEHLDYMHGTGHGVGYFLNVHEGPQSISYYSYNQHAQAKEGMLTSIEPGIYKEGKYGIRLENLVLNKYSKDKNFLCFEVLSLCPFEPSCIVKSMLSDEEKKWLNDYHKLVYKKLSKHLSKNALKWLKTRCKAI